MHHSLIMYDLHEVELAYINGSMMCLFILSLGPVHVHRDARGRARDPLGQAILPHFNAGSAAKGIVNEISIINCFYILIIIGFVGGPLLGVCLPAPALRSAALVGKAPDNGHTAALLAMVRKNAIYPLSLSPLSVLPLFLHFFIPLFVVFVFCIALYLYLSAPLLSLLLPLSSLFLPPSFSSPPSLFSLSPFSLPSY